MKSPAFSRAYASVYDVLYRAKDYRSEATRVHWSIAGYRPGTTRLLELGSGTGEHARYFSRWYDVVCVDRSRAMQRIARRKLAGHRVQFRAFDLGSPVALGRGFGACVSLFHVSNYVSRAQLPRLLGRVARALDPGGVLILDSWNGTAVARTPPSPRRRVFRVGAVRFVREVTPAVDWHSKVCRMVITLRRASPHSSPILLRERHVMTFYTPAEFRRLLSTSGFRVRRLTNDRGCRLRPDDWSMLAVATKRVRGP